MQAIHSFISQGCSHHDSKSSAFLVNKSLLVIQNAVIHSFFTHIPQRCNIQNLHHHWKRHELCTVPGQYLCYDLSKVTKRIYTTTYACPAVSWNSKGSKNPTSQTHIRSKNPIRHWELFATVTKLLDSYLHRLLPQMNFRTSWPKIYLTKTLSSMCFQPAYCCAEPPTSPKTTWKLNMLNIVLRGRKLLKHRVHLGWEQIKLKPAIGYSKKDKHLQTTNFLKFHSLVFRENLSLFQPSLAFSNLRLSYSCPRAHSSL